MIRRLQEEIQKEAQKSEHDVTPITMAILAGKNRQFSNYSMYSINTDLDPPGYARIGGHYFRI